MHQNQRRTDCGRGVHIATNHARSYTYRKLTSGTGCRGAGHGSGHGLQRGRGVGGGLPTTGQGATKGPSAPSRAYKVRAWERHIGTHRELRATHASSVALATLATPNFSRTTRTKLVPQTLQPLPFPILSRTSGHPVLLESSWSERGKNEYSPCARTTHRAGCTGETTPCACTAVLAPTTDTSSCKNHDAGKHMPHARY